MTDEKRTADSNIGILGAVSQLLVVYAIYLFISGWAFLDYYYRYYGIDTRWLDLGFYDTLVKGFTVLFTGGWILAIFYPMLILVPLAERKFANGFRTMTVIIVLLLAAVPVVYAVSRCAGERLAKVDKSDDSTLPTITFRSRMSKQQYHGKLLGFRSGLYFIHAVQLIPDKNTNSGPFEGVGGLELSLIRSEDISEVTVVEHR